MAEVGCSAGIGPRIASAVPMWDPDGSITSYAIPGKLACA
jgi:hypothetical protein